MRTLSILCLTACLGIAVSACDSADTDSGTASLTVRMTDAPFPFDLASEANVTITRIELVADDDTSSTEEDSGADRIVLFDGVPFDLNLLDLRDGVDTTLVKDLAIPADGSYRQLRFYVGEDASVVFNDGTVYDLKLPSAQRSGVKVMLPAFEAEGDEVDVLIDFDIEKSFVVRGNIGSPGFNGFLFKPVLEVESFEVVAPEETSEGGEGSGEETSGDSGETSGDGSEG